MEIIVKKPSEKEKENLQSKSTWSCDVSSFDWSYDSEEICLIIEGEVTIEYGNKKISFGAGDMVIFPKGLSCFWNVTKRVKKYYYFN